MGFSGAVQLWEEWQLRILVLGSLSIQFYLALFAGSRKLQIRSLYRLLIWLAYLGGDALAIYALATLFNRQRKAQQDVNESRDLEVLWAPILLIHLGGQINISAYNIEDNELWRRHILTAVSQVVVVIYVFCKSWSSSADKRFQAAVILLFSISIFKCFDKALALKRACFNSIVTTFHPAPRLKSVKIREVELEEYIQEAQIFVQQNSNPPALDSVSRASLKKQLSMPDKLFVDYAYVYDDRLTTFKSFWLLGEKATYDALCEVLSRTFDLIYTKSPQTDDKNRTTPDCVNNFSILLWMANLVLPIVPIALFHTSQKEAYKGTDIKVTFILLYITYFLEISLCFAWALGFEWSDEVAQHNLIGCLACNRRHTWLMGIAQFFQCKGLLDTFFGRKPCDSSRGITNLVREHAKGGWMSRIRDVESYWRFSDSRGQLTLERNGREEILHGSIEKPLDESIILWHMATDFCFYYTNRTSPYSKCARMCRQISNYMMHLLFANPEMLLPGSRKNLFTAAYHQLEAVLRDDDLSPLDERGLALRIINKAESARGFIQDSWFLARELMRFGDDNKMWELIQGVWIEMLCFSAGRCRGYLHAKSLGSGGEFLTYISLLMSHAGLETYAERQQRVQLRLPKEARQHIVRVKGMKKEIQKAALKMKRRMKRAAGASAEVQVVIS